MRRLKKVFTEATVREFNILTDTPPDNEVILLYRVDPQLSDSEWRQAFKHLYAAGVKHIIYIPSNILTLIYLFHEIKHRILYGLRGDRSSFAGYLRTATTYRSYWKGIYDTQEVRLAGQKSFILTRHI